MRAHASSPEALCLAQHARAVQRRPPVQGEDLQPLEHGALRQGNQSIIFQIKCVQVIPSQQAGRDRTACTSEQRGRKAVWGVERVASEHGVHWQSEPGSGIAGGARGGIHGPKRDPGLGQGVPTEAPALLAIPPKVPRLPARSGRYLPCPSNTTQCDPGTASSPPEVDLAEAQHPQLLQGLEQHIQRLAQLVQVEGVGVEGEGLHWHRGRVFQHDLEVVCMNLPAATEKSSTALALTWRAVSVDSWVGTAASWHSFSASSCRAVSCSTPSSPPATRLLESCSLRSRGSAVTQAGTGVAGASQLRDMVSRLLGNAAQCCRSQLPAPAIRRRLVRWESAVSACGTTTLWASTVRIRRLVMALTQAGSTLALPTHSK